MPIKQNVYDKICLCFVLLYLYSMCNRKDNFEYGKSYSIQGFTKCC